MADYTGGTLQADHLCVLVHGLWGNPNHMASVAKALRKQYPPDQVWILCARRNSGSFTYDGVELGGERVCLEIQEELREIERRGGKIEKLSIVGYSMGGLVARYAVGLLYAKGLLDELECMNFTAFASPFLGVRTPLKGWFNRVWNVLGARTLSMSGRQLFTVDKFRDTGRPLLAVLADPNSIFMEGLAKFRRRTLYANITNDRTAVYYTTGISKVDPYTDMSKVRCNFVPGYGEVVLDPANPVEHVPPFKWPKATLAEGVSKWAYRVPFIIALAVFIPFGVIAFLINSAVQTVRSLKRIRLHEKGLAGIDIADYRVPVVNEIREAVEGAYENLNSSQNQHYLGLSEDDGDASSSSEHEGEPLVKLDGAANGLGDGNSRVVVSRRRADKIILRRERKLSQPHQPTLALAPYQFEMIRALDGLGWHKYPVYIHLDRRSHAAMIVRSEKQSFREGRIVLKHWLNEEFLV